MVKLKSILIIILLGLVLILTACSLFPSNRLPPTPTDWIADREGWIPPLPPGLEAPSLSNPEDWDKILGLAFTDPEIMTQYGKQNIGNVEHFWTGYSGGVQAFTDSDSRIQSGKAHLPEEYTWYYPAVLFSYRSWPNTPGMLVPTRRLVGVDLKTNKLVYAVDDRVPVRP